MPATQEHRSHATQSAALARKLYEEYPWDAGEIIWDALLQTIQARRHESGENTHPQSKSEIRKAIASLKLDKLNTSIRIRQAERAARVL